MLKTIKVIDSWVISQVGMIVELENLYDGLSAGTILKSEISGLTWKIQNRIIESSIIRQATRFKKETEKIIHLNFKTPSEIEMTIAKMLEKDGNRIYKYQLMAIEHQSKPANGDTLVIQ